MRPSIRTARVAAAPIRCLVVLGLVVATHAPGALAQSLGNPFFSISLEPRNAAGAFPADQRLFRTSDTAVGGELFGGIDLGPYALPPTQANLSGVVLNNGQTFWADSMTPRHTTTPLAPETLVGGLSTVDVFQSFRRTSADSSYSFTYSAAFLELYKDVEVSMPCDGCIRAEVRWAAEVYLNSGGPALWTEGQSASIYDDNGTLRLEVFGNSSLPTALNPLWDWDCARCGLSSRGLGTATLQGPFRGEADLSSIPFDPSLPLEQQPEFTIHYTLFTYAIDDGIFSGARAFARDPLGGDGDVGLAVSGLTATNNPLLPVPEPATWALWLAGSAGLLAWRRRRTRL